MSNEINDILFWVANLEEGVESGLQPGQGLQDGDFNNDGTLLDPIAPVMAYPLDVLQRVRLARLQHGDLLPFDTEHKVLAAIARLMDRKDFFDRELESIAREFKTKNALPDEIIVECSCKRSSSLVMRRDEHTALIKKHKVYRCPLCVQDVLQRSRMRRAQL